MPWKPFMPYIDLQLIHIYFLFAKIVKDTESDRVPYDPNRRVKSTINQGFDPTLAVFFAEWVYFVVKLSTLIFEDVITY